MALTSASLPTKKRILSVCVKLFLEQGYKKTTVAQILKQAEVSNSSFQNIFKAKDGVLTELVSFMYERQFNMAGSIVEMELAPIYVYAAETAIQLTLAEMNENVRELYMEAYTHQEALDYIQHAMASDLHRLFGQYHPEFTAEDFYDLEIGSSGVMRSFMVRPCDERFTLEKKVTLFLSMVLRMYQIPEEEIARVLAFIGGLDLVTISDKVAQELFKELAMHYEFSLK